jgi:lycopene cyclase domain-containing protein
MSTYAWVDMLSVLFPFLFTFSPRLRFHLQWRATVVGILAMMSLFIPWDIFFTSEGVWRFAAEHTWSTRLLGLPLEEWGFFICIPYACLFTYHCITVQLKSDPLAKHARWISAVLAVALFAVALCNIHLKYTATTFLLCALLVLFVAFLLRPVWLGRFYLTFLLLLIPFLIVNGVLTGTGIQGEVVWYNDAENLGIRLLTIPIEDIFYGLLMQLLAVMFYEQVRSRWPSKASTA